MISSQSVIEALKQSAPALKAGEIAGKSGINKGEVDKRIKKLTNEGVVISPKRCFYKLKT